MRWAKQFFLRAVLLALVAGFTGVGCPGTTGTQSNKCTLTYAAWPSGSISGVSPQSVSRGASGTAVTATPSAGYSFVQWSDGSTQNPRTEANVTGNINVMACFKGNSECAKAISISSIDELQRIGNDPSYPLTACYVLTQNIDASVTATWNGGAGFVPIGSYEYPFTGVLDGQGYFIANLNITDSKDSSLGLFGYLDSGGQIQNIGLQGNVVCSGPESTVGGLVGRNDGSVTNCYATGGVLILGNNATAGGLVGLLGGGTITNCYATGDVSGTGTGSSVGGLVGAVGVFDGGSITNCYATGAVSGYGNVGGLAGENCGVVVNCHATGAVLGTSFGYVGGLVGQNGGGGSIAKCYATGTVSGPAVIGGLVGLNSGGGVSGSSPITNCYATGRVYGIGTIGGLVGQNDSAITDCYAVGAVSGTGDIGGLVGLNYSGSACSASYWDLGRSGKTTSAGGTGISTPAMMQQSTFVGWDFAAIWDIRKGASYPFLRSAS